MKIKQYLHCHPVLVGFLTPTVLHELLLLLLLAKPFFDFIVLVPFFALAIHFLAIIIAYILNWRIGIGMLASWLLCLCVVTPIAIKYYFVGIL